MPPKADPNEVRYITIKVFGGEGGPASTLAPKLGPLGLNAKKVGEDIIKESSKMKGIRQMIQLKIQNRAAEISVLPTSSTLLIKELGVKLNKDRKLQEIEKNWKISNIMVIWQWNKLKKLPKLLNIRVYQEILMAQWNKVCKYIEVLGSVHSIGATVDG